MKGEDVGSGFGGTNRPESIERPKCPARDTRGRCPGRSETKARDPGSCSEPHGARLRAGKGSAGILSRGFQSLHVVSEYGRRACTARGKQVDRQPGPGRWEGALLIKGELKRWPGSRARISGACPEGQVCIDARNYPTAGEEVSMSYNLLEEQWIPVLWRGGRPGRVSIREALTQAARIRQIAASSPMDNVALLRLLLAVLQWCKPTATQEELGQLRGEEVVGIPSDWLVKSLGPREKPKAAFDLLGSKKAFYQDEPAKSGPVAVTNLLHDFPSGSKIAHFRHTRDGRDGMCLPCCALGLVRWPSFASAGTAGAGQSMTASINGNTPTYSIAIGASLLATLLFTWPSVHAVNGDAALWDGSAEQSPLGFLKGMTWQSRRVLLAPPDAEGKRDLSPGRCCHCGEQTDRLVRSILFRPGWKRASRKPWSRDPHLLQITRKDSRSAKGEEKKIIPSWPSPNTPLEDHASVWRSVLEGLLQRSGGSKTGTTEFHTTLLGSSQALYKHVATHAAILPSMGPDVARRLLAELEWLRQATWVTTAARGRKWNDPPRGHRVVGAHCGRGAKGHAIRSGLCARSPLAESELEKAFGKLMRDMAAAGQADRDAAEQAVSTWRDEVNRILREHARQSVMATTSGSLFRRREATKRANEAVAEAIGPIAIQQGRSPYKPARADREKASRVSEEDGESRRTRKKGATR